MPSRTVETYPARTPLEARKAELACQVGVTVKTGFEVVQGDVLGRITADDLYRRRTQAEVTAAFAVDSDTGTVDDASVFVVGDVIENAAGATVGTIESIAGNVITLTANAAVAVAIGANVFGSDGSQKAAAISDEATDGTETQIPVFVCGLLVEDRLRGLDATAKTELGGASVAGGIFKF